MAQAKYYAKIYRHEPMRKYHCTRRHERRQCFQVEAYNPGQTYRRTVTEQARADDYYNIRISQEQPADCLSITTRKMKQENKCAGSYRGIGRDIYQEQRRLEHPR
jgi:hypothetical protein